MQPVSKTLSTKSIPPRDTTFLGTRPRTDGLEQAFVYRSLRDTTPSLEHSRSMNNLSFSPLTEHLRVQVKGSVRYDAKIGLRFACVRCRPRIAKLRYTDIKYMLAESRAWNRRAQCTLGSNTARLDDNVSRTPLPREGPQSSVLTRESPQLHLRQVHVMTLLFERGSSADGGPMVLTPLRRSHVP